MSQKTRQVIDPLLAKALAHPLRVQLLHILNEQVSSPNRLSKELDEPLGNVSYHIKVLLDYECIELVKKEPRRGALEHYYRALKRPVFNDPEWIKLPSSTQRGISRAVLEAIGRDVSEALVAGTFDEREDSHVSRTSMIVDEQGWDDIASLLTATMDRVQEIKDEATARLGEAGTTGIDTRVELMHFASPPSR